MKKILSVSLVICMVICLFSGVDVLADTNPEFLFNKVSGSEVNLLGYNGDDEIVEIPSEYEGIPVTTISFQAFSHQLGMKKVIIPDSVKEIGEYAFYGCSALEEVVFSENLQKIGDRAFFDCKKLKTVNLPSKITKIGEYALGYYEDIKSGYSVLIDDFEINGYTNSAAETYATDNEISFFSLGDAPLYIFEYIIEEASEDLVFKMARIVKYNGKEKDVIIPDSVDDYTVDNILSSAFAGNKYIETVTIPETIYNIGNKAFEACENLTTVNFEGNQIGIRDRAFFNCSKLANLNFNPNYSDFLYCTIGSQALSGTAYYENNFKNNAFYFNNTLVEVDKDVSSFEIKQGTVQIASEAFKDCEKLTEITIPGTVENIGSNSFEGCTSLSKIIFEPYSGYDFVYIENYAFLNCDSLKSVILSENVSPSYHSLGYSYKYMEDRGYWGYVKNDDFIIYGIKGSMVEEYANNNDIKFEEYDSSHTHDFEWVIDKKADCGAVGKKHEECLVCHDKRNENTVIAATGNHSYNAGVITKKATCKATGVRTFTCTVCKATKTQTIAKTTTHSSKTTTTTTKATLTKNGNIVKKCSVCGVTASTTTVYYAKTVKLSASSYTYNGKVKKPTVTVKDSKGKTISKSYYTVKYASGRKNVGKYKVTVTFKGNYSGTKTLYFTINPVKTSVSKITAAKKALTVSISKKSSQVTGYEIQYSTSKKFTKAKTATIKSYKTTKTTLKKLSAKKTYYVRVRTYKTVSGKKYYSGWSTVKSKKTK